MGGASQLAPVTESTGPREGRSTDYSSDLAKGFDAPIIHVNADDPEAAVASIRLAMAFRRRFGAESDLDHAKARRNGKPRKAVRRFRTTARPSAP